MSRLTKRYNKEIARNTDGIECSNYCTDCGRADCEHIRKVLDKLAHYEDLEEAGRLITLPCKVGTEVFFITSNEKIYSTTLGTIESVLRHGDAIGDGLYLTKAEAEQNLAELKGGGNDENNM